MNVTLRQGTRADAKECGRIEYEAFKAVADQRNFPPNFPSVEIATARVTRLLAHPGFYAVVAEVDGQVVGCNFLDERSAIAGIDPIAVDPAIMNSTIGRQLMQVVMDRATARHFPGMRPVQIAWHSRSLALYTKLGLTLARRSPPCRESLLLFTSPATRSGRHEKRISLQSLRSCVVLGHFLGILSHFR